MGKVTSPSSVRREKTEKTLWNAHRCRQQNAALPLGRSTLQLPEAPIQDGVEADVGGAVTQPARSLHTLSRGGWGGGGEHGGGGRVGVRGPLTSGGAGRGRGRRRGEVGESRRRHGERDVQEGAIPLRVMLRLLLLAARPRRPPALLSLGPVHRRGAPAPAAAHPDPHRGLPFCWGVGPAGGLLGPSTAAPDGCSLPAAGLQADLDLSEPGLAYRGGAQQAWAAHFDPQTTTTTTTHRLWSQLRSVALHVSLLLCLLALCPPFRIPLALAPAPSPPSFLLLLFLTPSLLNAAVMMLCLHSQALRGLRQPSVQFTVVPPAPSMHTICFNTSTCSHCSPPSTQHSHTVVTSVSMKWTSFTVGIFSGSISA